MKRLFALIVSFVLLSVNVSILNSWDIQTTQTQKIYKIIRLSGLSELATLPENDIIPVFQFALPVVPDSEWEELRKKYDSSNVVKEMADSLRKKFTQEEIDALYDLLEPFERMEIEYEPNEAPVSNFDLTLKYLKGLDSLCSHINDAINWEQLDSILGKVSFQYIDSIVDEFSRKEAKPRNQKSQDSVPDSLAEHSLLSSIELWAKSAQQFIEAYKDYLSALQKLGEHQLQMWKGNKEFNKLLKDIGKRLQKLLKEFEKESKEFQKKYKIEAYKIQKEIEKLQKQMKQRGNKELLPDSLFEKQENGLKKYLQKSKELLDKYYRFFKEYRHFRKEFEKRILEDLKRRGFIQE